MSTPPADPARPSRRPAPTRSPAAPDVTAPSPLAGTPAFPWAISLDRSLDVPVGAQLRGQLEYGIACGEIPRGTRLPSVRELSQGLGVAHVTVAQVFKDLLGLGLIVTARGRGTFVADVPRQPSGPDPARLHALLSDTIRQAEQEGYTLRQIGEVTQVLLSRGARPAPTGVSVLLIGLFADATHGYAANLRQSLRPEDRVHAVTLDDLRQPEQVQAAWQADVVLALAHRLAQAQALLPGVAVIPVGFIPAQTTRSALAALSPMARLTLVATFEEFLPTFLTGVKRFAPHVLAVQATHLHAPDLPELLAQADVIVYATGSDSVLELAPARTALEYRHIIDPRDVEQLVLPAAEARRKDPL